MVGIALRCGTCLEHPHIIISDKERMDRGTVKMVGTGGSAVSSMFGQLLTSAEVEEVRVLSCGAFDAEEDAAREMYSQSDL